MNQIIIKEDVLKKVIETIADMDSKHDLNTLTKNIEQWAIDRNLNKADPRGQMLKVVEELGEVAEGMAKNDRDKTIDGIGDLYVTIVLLAIQQNLDIRDCIDVAYDEIKDRKGKMIDGVFVKEEDL